MVFRKKPAPPKVKSATLSAQAEIPALREESQMSKWISVKIAKPPCPRGEARGTPVLIWPTSQTDGFGYYGRCATGKPAFYIYGAEIENVTHWQAMPEGPKAMSADMKAATEHARKCLAAERRLEEVERKARRDLQNQAKQHAEAKAALRKEAHTQLFNQGNVIEEQTARAESAEQRAAELTAALEAERKANDLIAQERDAFETALEAERKAHKETSRQANAAIETANASWGNEREVRHTIENTLTKIQRMSETGTAQSFLKLTDQGKARWFANALIESSARKKWQERAESAEATLETAAEDAAASWDAARAAEQRAADLQARQERVEEALRSIISSEKRGETAEYLAHIATRALSAQPKVAAGQAKNNLGLGSPRTQEPAPSAAPIAHSKSQYRRMTAQGADVAPPDAAQASDWPFKVLE